MSARDERGSMAVEVVLMTPILVMFTLLVVAGGRYVSIRADIEAAARDAARAASFERAPADAEAAAQNAISAQLDAAWTCEPAQLGGDFVAGGVVEVRLNCRVSNDGLGLIGLGGSVPMNVSGAAPLDTWRRTG